MAVFGGARLRTVPLPTAVARGSGLAAPTSVPTPPRIRPAGLLMAGILGATMLGLVYLTQTLGSNATSVEIRSLAAESEELGRILRNQRSVVQEYADAEVLTREATKAGLKKLGDAVVLVAP